MNKPSDAFKQMLRITLNRYGAVNLRDRGVFLRNLAFIYQVIIASENLLRVGIAMAPAGSPLLNFFEDHLSEERGHAQWLLQDLQRAGYKLQAHDWAAVELVGAQYYLMFHVNPVLLLGYMAVLEGNPMPLAKVEELEQLHGADLCRTLRYHAVHDVRHGEDIFDFFDTLQPGEQLLIVDNAIQTANNYGRASAHFHAASFKEPANAYAH